MKTLAEKAQEKTGNRKDIDNMKTRNMRNFVTLGFVERVKKATSEFIGGYATVALENGRQLAATNETGPWKIGLGVERPFFSTDQKDVAASNTDQVIVEVSIATGTMKIVSWARAEQWLEHEKLVATKSTAPVYRLSFWQNGITQQLGFGTAEQMSKRFPALPGKRDSLFSYASVGEAEGYLFWERYDVVLAEGSDSNWTTCLDPRSRFEAPKLVPAAFNSAAAGASIAHRPAPMKVTLAAPKPVPTAKPPVPAPKSTKHRQFSQTFTGLDGLAELAAAYDVSGK